MRKMVIELDPTTGVFRLIGKMFFKNIESFDGRAIIKLDLEKKKKLVVTDLTMKDGCSLSDFKPPKEMEILDVLKKKGNTYTLLLKMEVKKKSPLAKYYNKFLGFVDIDVIYDLPFHISEKKLVISMVGETGELEKALKSFKLLGDVKRLHFQKASFTEYDPLSCLTPKQKELIIEAKKRGYYDYPRKIGSQELAEQMGISKSTAIEHLRKAEMRLLSNILAGY
ncbi:MAG: helix-turn-helix domain-containing protein [Candidatus Thermoplasmatota archaeon]|nr:helix-turn-helix domain-containing protein [Candidatus Thermoplasmatota archaeon]